MATIILAASCFICVSINPNMEVKLPVLLVAAVYAMLFDLAVIFCLASK